MRRHEDYTAVLCDVKNEKKYGIPCSIMEFSLKFYFKKKYQMTRVADWAHH